MWEFYGLDWIAYTLAIIQTWMLGLNYRSGWLVGIGAAFSGIGFGLVAQSTAVAIFNVLFIALYIRNWKSIKK